MDAILQTWFVPSVKDSSLMFNSLLLLVLVECCSRLGNPSGTMCSNWFMCVRACVYLANLFLLNLLHIAVLFLSINWAHVKKKIAFLALSGKNPIFFET